MQQRLIDANVLFKDLNEAKIPFNADINSFIISAPTIDAVSVVRCKDCRYRNKECGVGYCRMLGKFTEDTFYCQYGAKKDEEQK